MWGLMEHARNTATNVVVVLWERSQSESGALKGNFVSTFVKGPTSAAVNVASMLITT